MRPWWLIVVLALCGCSGAVDSSASPQVGPVATSVEAGGSDAVGEPVVERLSEQAPGQAPDGSVPTEQQRLADGVEVVKKGLATHVASLAGCDAQPTPAFDDAAVIELQRSEEGRAWLRGQLQTAIAAKRECQSAGHRPD